ncbi:hypothetical protein TSUD_152250 [Trifolium subterraneum]|uniref:Uncharacterized protein n=1 Tax=Trifolium subterraneum TaxID=3900 RepID=A0A2Z6NA13_TRISU|nr:hypothetical protein TSUD_152250 [Trifolium subterraneum]
MRSSDHCLSFLSLPRLTHPHYYPNNYPKPLTYGCMYLNFTAITFQGKEQAQVSDVNRSSSIFLAVTHQP